ncbi:MAG: NAD(P)-dependent alcohol dehydrogenase, partial [Bacteroidota bacterium]
MKAIAIKKYGAPDVLQLLDLPSPKIDKDQVLVRVKCAAINPIDCKMRQGLFKLLTMKKFPMVLGTDLSGEIVKVGAQVKNWTIGDRVFTSLSPIKVPGAYCEYVPVATKMLARIPEELSYEVAASLPIAGLTALQALRQKGQIKTGMQVLINGASGGVGHIAVQLAKYFGAEVTGVCSDRNVDWVKSLGADRVIDYKKEDFVKDHRQRYDIIFDTIGVRSFGTAKAVMKDNSTFVTTIVNTQRFVRRFLTSFSGRKLATILTHINAPEMEEMAQLVVEGRVNIKIDRSFAFEEAAEAHRCSETGRVRGKLLINH